MIALRLCIILALLALTGCDKTYIDAAIGEKLQRVDATKLNGKWSDEEHNVFELRLSNKGDVVFGALSWDDKKQQFDGANKILDVRTIDETIYVFHPAEEESSDLKEDSVVETKAEPAKPVELAPDKLIFFQVNLVNASEMHIYLPDPKAIRNAIETGNLAGEVKKRNKSSSDAFIKALEEKSKEFIASNKWATLFAKEPTFKFKRINAD